MTRYHTLDPNAPTCEKCGNRFPPEPPRTRLCEPCALGIPPERLEAIEDAFNAYEAARTAAFEAARRWHVQGAYLHGINNPTVPRSDIRRASQEHARLAQEYRDARAKADGAYKAWQDIAIGRK